MRPKRTSEVPPMAPLKNGGAAAQTRVSLRCLGPSIPSPDVQWNKLGSAEFVFMSQLLGNVLVN